jgi:hypothetical protein
MKENGKLQQMFVGIAALGLLLMSGCTTFATLPREKILLGEKALTDAKESNASLNAPVEFKAAEDKLAEAKAAFSKKDYDKAARLAEQVSVDADYARAKGTSDKANKKAEELRQNIKKLRQEIGLLSKQ